MSCPPPSSSCYFVPLLSSLCSFQVTFP
jgi:hypothetical protein